MIFCIETLGCKVNQYETQAISELLRTRGHKEAEAGSGCDVCVINTCAVTGESSRKSRQAVRRMRKREPAAIIAVCGCLAQLEPRETAQKLEADLVGGSGDRAGFVEAVEQIFFNRKPRVITDDALTRRGFENLPGGSSESRTRALLKIQDGCDNYCAYCVIPYARGHVRSLPIQEAVNNAKHLSDEGAREIIITGIEIASYGKDLRNGANLTDLICAVSGTVPETRLRLGSLEPRAVTREFCAALSARGNICPHFHLSLQSGCDATLLRMRRRYDTAAVTSAIDLIRQNFPNCGITADLITGFPGETDAEFAETLRFIEKAAFSDMHIFPFSPREKTLAAKMDNQVPKALRHERASAAAQVSHNTRERFIKSQTGRTLTVLFERERDGMWAGYSENYLEVAVHGKLTRNEFYAVKVTGYEDGVITGTLVLR